MGGAELVVSATMLTRLYLLLLYLPIVWLGASLLFPRLSSSAKVLAAGMLIGQTLFILMTLESAPASSLEWRLWHIDGEWNLPAAFAALQMALVGAFALAISARDKENTAWRRIYFIGLGAVFLFIALDDFTGVFKSPLYTPWIAWKQGYRLIGAATVVGTVITARRAPRDHRAWYLCLLLGLALIGIGGLALDNLTRYCGVLGFVRLDGCITYHTLEEGFELLGTWLSLLAVLGLFTGSASIPPVHLRRVLVAILLSIGVLLVSYLLQIPQELRRLTLQFELANDTESASVDFESGIGLLSYQIEKGAESAKVGLYLSTTPRSRGGAQFGVSIHLVDQVTGESVANLDRRAGDKQWVWLFDTESSSVYRQWMEVDILVEAPVNRALWIVLTVWRDRDGEFERQDVIAGDLQRLDEAQLVLGELVIPAASRPPSGAPLAVLDGGIVLESADLPERTQAGELLRVSFTWRNDEGGHEDVRQFLHFVHEESGKWWGYDQLPLGQRLPTRLWYSGLADAETWLVPLPDDLAPGRYAVYTGLYRAQDLTRLPAVDAAGQTWQDARVTLGYVTVGR